MSYCSRPRAGWHLGSGRDREGTVGGPFSPGVILCCFAWTTRPTEKGLSATGLWDGRADKPTFRKQQTRWPSG